MYICMFNSICRETKKLPKTKNVLFLKSLEVDLVDKLPSPISHANY